MNTKEKGDVSEAMIIAACLCKGFMVLKPLSDRFRFDAVIDRGNGFERVQCKTGRFRKGAVVFNSSSRHYHRHAVNKSYRGEVELFGVFCPDNGKCYLIPVNDVAVSCGSVRVDPARNNQSTRIRMAQDYEITP